MSQEEKLKKVMKEMEEIKNTKEGKLLDGILEKFFKKMVGL